jgi:hypothetical protein
MCGGKQDAGLGLPVQGRNCPGASGSVECGFREEERFAERKY